MLCRALSGAGGRGRLSSAAARVEVGAEGRLWRKLISLATLAARHLLAYRIGCAALKSLKSASTSQLLPPQVWGQVERSVNCQKFWGQSMESARVG